MIPIQWRPELLPAFEELIFLPRFKGASGQVTLSWHRENHKIEIQASAELGLSFFMKRAVDYRLSSLWSKNESVWELQKYREHNLKSERIRDLAEAQVGREAFVQVSPELGVFDPLGLLYALRATPLQETGDRRQAILVRADRCLQLEIRAETIEKKSISAFGKSSRDVVRLGIFAQKSPEQNFKDLLNDGRASVWIDRELNIISEVAYEFPPFGRVRLELNEIRQ
jgi:hypothetical protein